MVKLMKMGLIALVGVVIWGFTPGVVFAAKSHTVSCNECHRSSANPRTMANLCVNCHTKSGTATAARFNLGTASNALGNNPNPANGSGAETSHFWGGNSTLQAAAGSAHPPTTFYTSRYATSKNRITCTICHDPHGEAGTMLVRAAIAGDVICQQCHSQWFVANPEAELTHPIVANYAAIAAANPTKYKATVSNVGNGGVRLVNGGVSCTSCHGTHYADSSSSTVDSTATYNNLTMAKGDGKILRSDGALSVGGTRNGINGTAQLRSNLCQSCHTYKMHGKGLIGAVQIGCLECHEAHSSNAYTLRSVTPTAVPKRANRLNIAADVVNFPPYPAVGNVRTKWSDDTLGTATGYCEVCHGDVQDPAAIGGQELEHLVGGINPCTACHKHNDPANIHSFNIDANAATCGQCHGFPPYLNAAGDRDTGGTDGGYARNEVDGAPYDYTGRSHFLDESTTAHKTHAGADLPTNPGTWYFVGRSGIENCMPCHGNSAGSTGGGHRIAPSTDPNTFRNVNFNQFGTGNGHYTPTYSTTTNQCSSTYCHSNGGPRTSDSTRDYSVVVTTPAWVGNGTTAGFNSIQGKGTRCQSCHGDSEATMGVAQKKNSPAHLVHLNKGYGCEVCHINTALNNSTLEPNATNGRIGGEHVNLIADISYKNSGTPLSVAMAINVNGPLYNTTTGTCSIYCHDPGDTGNTVDWDSAANMQCDSCHKGLLTDTSADGGLGPITSGSHLRHVSDATGPKLGCDECHGAGSSSGNHSGMLDGAVVVVAGVCNTCHAVDAGETVPVWGNPVTGGCIACHTGTTTTPGGLFTTAAAPAFPNFLSTGHGKPSGTYAVTSLPAANKACLDCHATASTNHYDNIAGNDDVLIGGFSCEGCHDGMPATAVKTHSNTNPAYTGQKRGDFTKLCLGCHTPHGSANLAMIAPIKTDFGGTVAFTSFGNASPVANDNSFDESGDSPVSNLDDICATCHTATAHNNRAMAGAHQEGKTCIVCHSHNGAYGGFMPTGGTACNDCHGNPPATGAHAMHTTVSGHTTAEDLSDCANCHTGAETYTYGPGGNHQNTVVNVAVGWSNNGTPANKNDDTCATACHVAASDGFWGDTNGLNCDSCHYYAASPVSGNNLSDVHDEHFAKSKPCSACHNMAGGEYNNGTAIIGPLLHINNKSGANEGVKFTGMAQALMNEAGFDEGAGVRDVVRSGMVYTDTNTCTGGITTGCHASGTADWDIVIPATNAGCVMCHTETNTAAYNPTSGLHDNNPSGPTVTGNAHDDSFDNGSAGTADCVTCHTASPTAVAANHINGTLNTGAAITVAGSVGYNQPAGTCATACHSAGATWSYKWSATAYATNGTECANCHGDYASGWIAGVAPHTEFPTRGDKHNNVGNLTYPCSDCHAIGSAGYKWTSKWDPTGTNSNHGDDKITMNQVAGVNTFAIDTVPTPDRAGCSTTSCHGNAAAYNYRITTTSFTTQTVTGPAPAVLCSGCHGGTVGTSANGYWPDSTNTAGNNTSEDNSGAHLKHMTALVSSVMGQTIPQLLTDNVGIGGAPWNTATSDVKQKELCTYCHGTAANPIDATHGLVSYLPADVNTMFNMWNKAADNGTYPGSYTCATVDCHFNKTTPTTNDWYDAPGNGNCAMCHNSGAADVSHTEHTGGGFGKTIDCASCHQAATTTTVVPATGHIDGTFTVAGSETFTYTGLYPTKGTCGTNVCHNNGKGAAPTNSGAGSYTWGTALTDCTACHNNPNATGNDGARHTKHMANTTYVPGGCIDCHPAGTAATHINGTIQATGAKQSVYTAATGTCTNTCHTVTDNVGDWTDTNALVCTTCHQTGTYVGSGANLQTSGLHAVTVAVKHDGTLPPAAASACINCHAATVATVATNHINGILQNATAITYAWNANVVAYVPATGCQAALACHTDGGGWKRKWTGVTDAKAGTGNPGDAVCQNCHGDQTGWRWNEVNASTTDHTDTNGNATDNVTTSHGTCQICHGWGDAGYNKTWLTGKHGDGLITMNGPVATGSGYNNANGGCDTQGCHVNDASHQMKTGSIWAANFGDYGSGSCSSCHGGGTAQAASTFNYWPDGATYPDKASRHSIHITRLAAQLGYTLGALTDVQQKHMCAYCHNDATGVGGAGHATDSVPTGIADAGAFNPQWDIANPPTTTDTGSSFTTADGSCVSIDCHNNVTATAGTYGWNNASTSACVMCHTTYSATDTTHSAHLIGGTYGMTINCASCHEAATTVIVPPATGHINGTLAVAGSVPFTYSGGLTGSCATNTCHNDGNGGTPYSSGAALGAYNWGTVLTNCTACHNNPNATGNGGARHTKHMAANVAYVPTGCADCHPAANVATHLDGTRNATGTRQTLYTSATGTCTNTCHTVTDNVGDWTDANALVCTTCHQTGTYIGSGANLQVSGLHGVTVAVKHDGTLAPAAASACINCHAAAPTSVATNHINGTLQNATVITYAWNANVISFVPATGCQAAIACHTDGGDWRRKWAGVTDAKPLATDNPGAVVCQNCHGDFTNGWRWNELNATTTDHTDPNGDLTDQMSSNHGTCQNCHGWGDAAYNKTWATGQHGDGFITLNGPSPATGAAYDNTTGGCALSCHGDIAGRRMNSTSGWTANYGNYGAGSCFTCHGNGSNQYWPDGVTYPDKGGRHTIHITRLAAKLAITLPGTDLEQKRLCAYCHNDAAGIGASGHNTNSVPTGVADVGAINPIWSAGNPPSTADAGSAFNTTDGSCASIDCHNNKTAPAATFGWRDATTTTCTMCHTAGGASNDPTSGLHNLTPTVSSQRHDNTVTGGCAACHTSLPAIAPASTHINGTFTGNGFIAGEKTNMGLITAYTATVDNTGSCLGSPTGNAGCHAGAGDAGTWARKWDSTISGLSNGTECKGCHGGFAETDWTFGSVSNLTDGSVEHNRNWDADANTGEVIGAHKDNLANTSRCNVCHVYGDAGYVFGTNHRNGQLEMNSTSVYSAGSCTSSCHVNNTGHVINDPSGWTIGALAGPALACDSCHGGSGQYWPNNVSTAVGDYPNRKGRHDLHMAKLALKLGYALPGNDAQQKAMCIYCHNDGASAGLTGHDDRLVPANQGSFNHIGTAAVDANGTYSSVAPGTCTTVDCHNNKLTTGGTYGWYDSATTACLMCHTLGGANNPTSGLHNIVPTISGATGQHDDSFGSGGTNTCINCHTTLPTVASTHINGTFTGNGTIVGDKTNMGLFNAYTATVDNIGTCVGSPTGAAGCHAGTGDAGTWARQWNSANAIATTGNECKGCHGGFAGTDWTFGSTRNISDGSTEHQYNWDLDANTSEVIGSHKDNAANTTRCNTCHVYADAPYATLGTNHRNGTIEMNSTVEYNTTNFNCTGSCHAANNINHNLDTSGWTVNPIAGPALACSSCHGGGTAQSGGFNYWPDGTIYPDNNNGTRHLSHITKLAARLGFTMGALTDAQQKRMCSYCHDNVGGIGHNDATAPADTNFHPFWDATNPASVVDTGAIFADATGVCSNIDCHNNKTTLDNTYDWNAAGATACVMCHTAGGATNDPISGLHSGTFSVVNSAHDDTFATGGTCATCHTILAVAVGSSHINGTFSSTATIAGDKTNMGLSATYTALTITNNGTGTCSGAGVAGTCHGAANTTFDGGSWARKWDSNLAGKTDGTECTACHGGFNSDWTFDQTTVIANNTRHAFDYDGNNGAEIMGNHANNASQLTKCNTCHVYGDVGYTLGTNHRDGKISMNSSTTYSGTAWNCTQVCHVSNVNHALTASSSTAAGTRVGAVAGPALACYTCHGGSTANSGSSFNYWPDGTAYPDKESTPNRHLAHITKLAAKLNYTMATLTDQQQKTMCAFCHPYTASPGEAGHNDNVSPTDVTSAAFNPLWSTITTNYPSTADNATAAATWTTGTQQCSGIDCHNNQTTTGTWAWNSTATTSCLLCHNLTGTGNNPTSGLHRIVPTTTGAAGTHDDSFGVSGTCASCHTTLPAMAPATTHMNGFFTANSTIAGDKTAMGLFAAYTQSANDIGTCSNAGGAGVASAACHGDGVAAAQKGDAGTWKRIWNSTINAGTGGAECANCHGGFSGSDWTFGVTSGAANTGDTITDHMANYDGDGLSNELAGNHSSTTQVTRCNNCHIYGDGAYVWATNHRNNTIEVNSTTGMTTVNRTCTTYCHVSNTGHVLDAGGWTVATLVGPAIACTTCHSTITTHTDADGPGATYPTAGNNFCLDCHTSHSTETFRTGVNAANNVYISTISARVVVGGANDTGTAIPTMDDQYASHDSYIQLGGTATTGYAKSTEAEMCWACHDAVTASAYTLSGVSVTFTNTSATVGTIAATGIGNKFAVGRWITISGSTVVANNRTFKVATSTANSLTVTINAGDGPLSTVTNATGVVIVSPTSEWQVNEKAATGTLPYDYGMLFNDASTVPGTQTSNWTTGFWRSGKGLRGGSAYNPAWYKRGAIQSTHSANIGGTFTAAVSAGNSLGYNRTETKDAVGNIRCSYCHDVHGTHDGVNGDVAGSPYLRGTWKGNPYNEDMAPQYGMSAWTYNLNYGLVPRSSAATTNSGLATVAKVGAYWIDQNSGNPNNGLSSTQTAGLCDQCHSATKNGTWTAAEIGTIDQVTAEALWTSGYNGHANSVLTGSGVESGAAPTAAGAEIRARNIFTRTKRGSATLTDNSATQATMNMGAVGVGQGYSYRGAGSGYIFYPRVMNTTELGTTAGRPFAFNNFAWSVPTPALTQDVTIGAEATHDGQTKYHNFNCAKCHNPHASRLPKLMITNCLDANHNTWEDKSTFTGSALPAPWTGTRHSQWATAQNCHRLDSRAVLATGPVSTLGTGWNKATPWQESTTPNTTIAADPNP